VDGQLKAGEHLLEQLKDWEPPHLQGPPNGDDNWPVLSVNPQDPDWPDPLIKLYNEWPDALLPHPRNPDFDFSNPEARKKYPEEFIKEMCRRTSFEFGEPYYEKQLVPEIHESELPNQFGEIPLIAFLHSARNVRRRWAANYYARNDDVSYLADCCRERFRALDKVTYMTGEYNRLWHRDSIDRMYEWLQRGTGRRHPGFRKYVLKGWGDAEGFGHQDLYWGKDSPEKVMPKILAGLSPPA
jgi:hypothetical protein